MGSTERSALHLLPCYHSFILLPALFQGQGQRNTHTLPHVMFNRDSLREESKAPRVSPWVGVGEGTAGRGVSTTAKQQAEELLSAPHFSTLTPGSLSPAHGPPDNRVGHSLSPHARQVLQSSLLPTSRAFCTPFVLPVSCYARAESPELHTMPGPCSCLQFPGDHRAKPSGKILNGLFPILGQN